MRPYNKSPCENTEHKKNIMGGRDLLLRVTEAVLIIMTVALGSYLLLYVLMSLL